MADKIQVTGLREFNRSLKQLDSDLPKAVRLALNEAAQVVVDYAQPRVPTRSGRARRSIRPQSTRTAVRVSAGGRRAPYYPWLDFGGAVGPRKSVRRPFLKHGRYLYAGYFAKREQIIEKAQQSLLDVAKAAGLEVE